MSEGWKQGGERVEEGEEEVVTVSMGEGLLLARRIKMGMGELLLILLMPLASTAFNLDTENAVVYQVSQG